MFEYNHSGQSELKTVNIEELFEDIKLSSGGINLKDEGYIPFEFENTSLGLQYFVKPTKEVIEYMTKSGRGMPSRAELLINDSVAFSSTWKGDNVNYTTTPRIAGVVDKQAMIDYKKNAELIGDSIVGKAYKAFHRLHPNYALRYIREPQGSELSNIRRHAGLVWLAVGYQLDNEIIKQKALNGDYDDFYLYQSKLNFLNDEFDLGIRALHPDKDKGLNSESEFGM